MKQLALSLIGLIAAQNCKEGWIYYEDHCYKFHEDNQPWALAESECQHAGGHLASELDEREHDFILQIPALLNSQTYVWIGQYRDKTKNFQWTDESEWKKWDGRGDYGKMPWARNEPSEETGRDCTRLQTRVPDLLYLSINNQFFETDGEPNGLRLGQWSMFTCEKRYPFLCKYNIADQPPVECQNGYRKGFLIEC